METFLASSEEESHQTFVVNDFAYGQVDYCGFEIEPRK